MADEKKSKKMSATKQILAGVLLGLTTTTPAGASSIFKLQEPPTAAGRRQYINVITATMAPAIVGAVPCQLRSQQWKDDVRGYTIAMIGIARPHDGEKNLTTAEIGYAEAALRYEEAEAAKSILRSPAARCRRISHDVGMQEGDAIEARAKKLRDSPDPWAGLIRVVPAK